MAVTRFGVSLETDLLEALDDYVLANKLPNRSQAIRKLIEINSVVSKWKCNNVVAGVITLIYGKDKADVKSQLLEIERLHSDIILSVQQFFISSEKIMEVVAVKGPSYRLTDFSDLLIGVKGIEHGKLNMSKAE